MSAPRANSPLEYGYLASGALVNREAASFERTPGVPPFMFCGDDGFPNLSSRRALLAAFPEALNPAKGGGTIFGQAAGFGHVAATAGLMVHRDKFADRIRAAGGFSGFTAELVERINENQGPYAVRVGWHTAVANELDAWRQLATDIKAEVEVPDELKELYNTLVESRGPVDEWEREEVTFCPHGSLGIGCAFCMKVGSISTLAVGSSDVNFTLAHNIATVTGTNFTRSASIVHHVARGNQALRQLLDEEANREPAKASAEKDAEETLRPPQKGLQRKSASDIQIGRQQIANSGLPVMVLERQGSPDDAHLPPEETGVIVDLDPMRLRNPRGSRSYGMSIGVATLALRQALPLTSAEGLDVAPEVFIYAQLSDGASVRHALAGRAAQLAIGVRGNLPFSEVIDKIKRMEKE